MCKNQALRLMLTKFKQAGGNDKDVIYPGKTLQFSYQTSKEAAA